MATQTMRAIGPTKQNRMKASLPSPTLTNPDMVLPNEAPGYRPLPSPPRNAYRARPPSPSYLRDKTNESPRARSGSSGSSMTASSMNVKKEKRGLMSRKMMLLRSRTASSGIQQLDTNPIPKSAPSDAESDEYTAFGSSPTLMDAGNLAPEKAGEKRMSSGVSSLGSDDMDSLSRFVARYDTGNASGTEDEMFESSPAAPRYGYAITTENDMDTERRQKQEDEQTSAISSEKADKILAEAKKRLNLMEGNLRGARDLVTPLTAANLKRATSASGYVSTATNYSGRNRHVHYPYDYELPREPQYRTLHAQASSPTMGKDFRGHWRGYSEAELPERPYTALERMDASTMGDRAVARTNHANWSHPLKVSRSYDSIGANSQRRATSRDPLSSKGSPDPHLGPLVEDDGSYYHTNTRSTSSRNESHDGLGFYRSPSRTSDLQEQMSTLKGRILSLKDRQRADSLRRQSMQSLREPSPLNNAMTAAPEFFYQSSPTYGGPALDTNAFRACDVQQHSSSTPVSIQKMWEPNQFVPSSRNAFAEQAQRTQEPERIGTNEPNYGSEKYIRSSEGQKASRPKVLHRRTPSGTAIVEASKHRYSHHQYYHARNDSGDEPAWQHDSEEIGIAHDGTSHYGDDESEAGATVYEDAQTTQTGAVVAHEDREDAFDYETFFLHSAMSGYNDGAERSSISSQDSVSSVETARGPTTTYDAEDEGGDEAFEYESEDFPPGTPETPEKLREIEQNLHRRTFSEDSVSTLATFATATEGRDSPPDAPRRSSGLDWPIPPSTNSTTSRSTPNSRPNSRPGTATARPSTAIPVKQIAAARSDTSSERADSGVALGSSKESQRSPPGSQAFKSATAGSVKHSTLSPPMSPRSALSDPSTVVVNALIRPDGRQLGLKDKAVLFGLVDSLKKICHGLQDSEETAYESRMLRRRLDEARKVMDSLGE